jgi:hypothetical protein
MERLTPQEWIKYAKRGELAIAAGSGTLIGIAIGTTFF